MVCAEILSIGTELLLGQILNTNSQFLSTELAAIGIDCYFHTTVGDNKSRIFDSLQQALNRADVILTTGGLGPTDDDLTVECMAEFFGVELVFDKQSMDKIEEFFKQRGYPMVESNRKQAYRPAGSQILPNPRGTAPGIIWKVGKELLQKKRIKITDRPRYILTFPGVPSEMKVMWAETARQYLSDVSGQGTVWSCELKHFGIGESSLAEKYGHLLHLQNPTVAPLAGTGECRLRVTAKAQTVEQAKAIAMPIIEEIKTGSGPLCYGQDADTLESVAGDLLRKKGLTVAFAESCTGGLASKRLTDVPGSSDYIKLNVVTYANEAKQKLLGVSSQILDEHGAVSEECAAAMAQGVRKLADADIGIGITGIAGPGGGTAEKPVGLVYIGLADANGVYVRKQTYPERISRADIRFRSASDAINLLRVHLLSPEPAKIK